MKSVATLKPNYLPVSNEVTAGSCEEDALSSMVHVSSMITCFRHKIIILSNTEQFSSFLL